MDRAMTEKERCLHRSADFREIGLEYKLIGGILKSTTSFGKIIDEFKSDALTIDKLREIYQKAVYIFRESNETLTIHSLKVLLKVPKYKVPHYVRIYTKCKTKARHMTVGDVMTTSKRLMQMYRGRICEIGLKDVINDLGKGIAGDLDKVDDATKKIEKLWIGVGARKVAAMISNPIVEYEPWKRQFIHIQKHPELLRNIPTGVDPIDKCLIGIRDAELGLIAAPTGIGKSIALMNFGANCWLTTGDVAVFTIEMPSEQYYNRFYCWLSGLDYDRFRRYEFTREDWERMDRKIQKARKHDNKFFVIDMPEGCTTSAIRAEVEILLKRHKIRMVLVDYLNIMGNSNGAFGLNWEFQVQSAMELKLGLARPLRLPIWTAAQTNDKEDTAFASHIKDHIDIGIKFWPTEDYKETHMLMIDWIKTRDFEGVPAEIYTQRDRMRIWTPNPDKKRGRYGNKVHKLGGAAKVSQ